MKVSNLLIKELPCKTLLMYALFLIFFTKVTRNSIVKFDNNYDNEKHNDKDEFLEKRNHSINEFKIDTYKNNFSFTEKLIDFEENKNLLKEIKHMQDSSNLTNNKYDYFKEIMISGIILFSISTIHHILTLVLNLYRSKSFFNTLKISYIINSILLNYYLFQVLLNNDNCLIEIQNLFTFRIIDFNTLSFLSFKSNIIIFSISRINVLAIVIVINYIQRNYIHDPISNINKLIKLVFFSFFFLYCLLFATNALIKVYNKDDIVSIHDKNPIYGVGLIYLNLDAFETILTMFLILVYVIILVMNSVSCYNYFKLNKNDNEIRNKVSKFYSHYIVENIYFMFSYFPLLMILIYISINENFIGKDNSKYDQEYVFYLRHIFILIIPSIQIFSIIFKFVSEINRSSFEFKKSMKDILTFKNSFSEEFSSIINYEFICCIVYGFNDIFNKNRINVLDSTHIITDENLNFKEYIHNTIYSIANNQHTLDNLNNNIDNHSNNPDNQNKGINENANFEQESKLRNSSKLDLVQSKNDSRFKDAKIIEHYPKCFSAIKEIDKIKCTDISNSFCPNDNRKQLNSIKESEGKSGSFFFVTKNKNFIIKTIKESELKTFKNGFMKDYFLFMNENKSNTLISRIYGVFSVKLSFETTINVILMQNLVKQDKINIYRIFDLKGSKIDRITEDIMSNNFNKMKALKDLDFMWIDKAIGIMDLTLSDIDYLKITLENDLTFLRDCNLMDYSLLLIIINNPDYMNQTSNSISKSEKDLSISNSNSIIIEQKHLNIFVSRTRKYIYSIGIIDYLQVFNTVKFMENKYKTLFYCSDVKNISAVDPNCYAQRMKNFIFTNTFISNKFKNT